MRRAAAMLLATSIATSIAATHAAHLGVHGPLYPVREPDLLELIEKRLREKEKSGELARLERQMQARARQWLENPPPVEGLARTTTPRTFYHDPSYVVHETIHDHEGRIIAAPGTRINPLDHVSLTKHLLFFDARDEAQTRKALELYRHYQGRVRLILTGGSFVRFMKRHDIRVWYDQEGRLVRHFGIRQVPALVSQEDKRLRIDELAV